MAEAPERLRAQQFELARHLRDPRGHPPPPGIEDRRLAVYRELVFNNVQGLLAGNFPVIRRLLGQARWTALVHEFLRDHRCRTPLFPEIAREFLRFLETRDGDADTPPFLQELAHYEWVELALQICEQDPDTAGIDRDGDLLAGIPVLSPLAWALAYRWPVHRLGPGFQPAQPPPAPTLLLLRREAGGRVHFSELSPLAFRLLQRLGEHPDLAGRTQLQALAREAGDAATGDDFLTQGHALLQRMAASGVVLGARTLRSV